MSKYRETFAQMMDENKELFENFKAIHDAYVINPEINKLKFNALGSEVMDVIRDYERRFLGHMSRGTYGKFAASVSEKFMAEVQKSFPKIMFVGVE